MISEKQIIIGLGTGRCGSQSLASLLDSQGNTSVTHECEAVLPWVVNIEMLENKLQQISTRPTKRIGDVAYYYLPYLPYLLENYPNIKFICMQRPMTETVVSYMKKTTGRNHWNYYNQNDFWRTDVTYDPTYPKYQALSPEKAYKQRHTLDNEVLSEEKMAQKIKEYAIAQYWRDYYTLAETYENNHPNRFKIVQMRDLNHENSVNTILDFCEISQKRHVFFAHKLSDG